MATIETSEDTKIVIEPSEMQVMENGEETESEDVTTAGIDATDNSCNNCAPQNINIKEELSLSSVSDDDVGPSITLHKKSAGIHKGMMDIALLTANANQLRFLITYNSEEKTFYISAGLIVLSLIIQLAVGIGLIFKRRVKRKGNRCKADKIGSLIISGIFCLTVINILAASFTTTTTIVTTSPQQKSTAHASDNNDDTHSS